MAIPIITLQPPVDPPSAPTDPGVSAGTSTITKTSHYAEVKFLGQDGEVDTRYVSLDSTEQTPGEMFEELCASEYLQLAHDVADPDPGAPDPNIVEGRYDDERIPASRFVSFEHLTVSKKWTVVTTVTPVV